MDIARATRLYAKAEAARWKVRPEAFSEALERSAARTFRGRQPSPPELDRYFDSLHLADLALACACTTGDDSAWDHFVTEFRPALYRAADAIDSSGGAREIADALYGELFGVRTTTTARKSPFDYFHGRSSLSTWLRSLVSQRYIDRHRQARRLTPLPEDASPSALHAPAPDADPDRSRYLAAMRAALGAAIAALAPRDRLRVACYYAEQMTLAQIARLTREHEATVSRHLARTRRDLRQNVERRLRDDHGFSDPEISECFASLVNDAGNLDLGEWLDTSGKNPGLNRSMSEATEGADGTEKNRPT